MTRRVAMVTVHTSPIAVPGSADAGGMNIMVTSSAIALAEAGWQVDLVTRRTSPDQERISEPHPGVRLHHLDAGPVRSVAKADAEILIQPFADAFRAWLAADGAGTDIVHSHHWFSGVAALDAAHAAGLPHVMSYHSVAAAAGRSSLDAGEQPESAGRRAGEAWAAQHSELILAVSSSERRTIIADCGADPSRIRVVHPGVDIDLFHPRTDGDAAGQLLCVARIEPLKGVDATIRITHELHMLTGEPRRLTIAGGAAPEWSSYAETLRRLVRERDLSEYVRFVGPQDRAALAALLRGSDLLINPSFSETYGIINLEAAASGTPVIAHRSSGMCESVWDGRTGILMDNRDDSAWARTAADLLGDDDRRRALSSSARATAVHRPWAVVAEELGEAYTQLL